jgi:hypothetical protein
MLGECRVSTTPTPAENPPRLDVSSSTQVTRFRDPIGGAGGCGGSKRGRLVGTVGAASTLLPGRAQHIGQLAGGRIPRAFERRQGVVSRVVHREVRRRRIPSTPSTSSVQLLPVDMQISGKALRVSTSMWRRVRSGGSSCREQPCVTPSFVETTRQRPSA